MPDQPQLTVRVLDGQGDPLPRFQPSVEYIGTFWRPLWRTEQAIEFEYLFNSSGGITLHIPAGFKTDFASVPRFLWSIYPPQSIYNVPALFHDRLCVSNCDRTLADEIFRVLLDETPGLESVSALVKSPMYRAVRTYGLAKKWWQRLKACWLYVAAFVAAAALLASVSRGEESMSQQVQLLGIAPCLLTTWQRCQVGAWRAWKPPAVWRCGGE